MVVERDAGARLKKLTRQFPCVAVLGPRQVGKTTLVKNFAAATSKKVVYLDMERHSDRVQLSDPELFLQTNRPCTVIVDEVQLFPALFEALRPEIDALRKPGRFILTGSASPDLVKGVSESLAGRITYLDIHPVSLVEAMRIKNMSVQKHWFRGGFPSALLARSNEACAVWADSFIRSYVERDLSALFGVGITPSLARNFWSMVAIQNGNLWNSEAMARSLGVSGPTVSRYLDFLEGAFLIRKLPAWFVNTKKRMVKAPKVYVRDSGLLHYLNNVGQPSMLPSHPAVGASWEGYVIEKICKQLPHRIRPYFYRTHHGAEVDLILSDGVKPISCIEIKYSLSPSVRAGFYECVEELKSPSNFVIYPGEHSYLLNSNVRVVSLPDFLEIYLRRALRSYREK